MTIDIDLNTFLILGCVLMAFWRFPSKTRMKLEMKSEIDSRQFPSQAQIQLLIESISRELHQSHKGLQTTLGHNIDRHADHLQGIDFRAGRASKARETIEDRLHTLEAIVMGWSAKRHQA